MTKFNLQTGNIGENIARKYLEDQGYKILERNFKTKYAEIDLVAKQKDEIIFIEVKTRRGLNFGSPEEALNKRKIQKIWLNAQGYINFKKWQGPYRIDAICIVLNSDDTVNNFNHYQNII
jgi:putative endonuclease